MAASQVTLPASKLCEHMPLRHIQALFERGTNFKLLTFAASSISQGLEKRAEPMRTRLTDLLGVKLPIVGGTMMDLSTPEFVAAICEAGALGVLASAGW